MKKRRTSTKRSPKKRRTSTKRSPKKRRTSTKRSPKKRRATQSSPRRGQICVKLRRSTDKRKKFDAIIFGRDGPGKLVRFGARGYSDYTKHKNPERKERYLVRHKKNEDWTLGGIETAGFWARWILWGEPTLQKSIKMLQKKFPRVKIHYGKSSCCGKM
jgi:hypothetical protein